MCGWGGLLPYGMWWCGCGGLAPYMGRAVGLPGSEGGARTGCSGTEMKPVGSGGEPPWGNTAAREET